MKNRNLLYRTLHLRHPAHPLYHGTSAGGGLQRNGDTNFGQDEDCEVSYNAIKVVYFIRDSRLPVTSSSKLEDDMCKSVEFGLLTVDFRCSLGCALKEMYAPLLGGRYTTGGV